MESYVVAIIGINSGKCDNRASKIAADIFHNGFWIAEVRLCVNINGNSGRLKWISEKVNLIRSINLTLDIGNMANNKKLSVDTVDNDLYVYYKRK